MSEMSLVELTAERYSRGWDALRDHVSQWEEVCYFVRGDQWLTYSGNAWRADSSRETWRVRMTVNLILPNLELAIATYMRAKPIVSIDPASAEESDRKLARVAESVVLYYWDHLNFDVTLHDLLLWQFSCGNAYLQPVWNAKAGKVQTYSEQLVNPSAQAEAMVSVTTGQAEIEVLDPFSLVPEPGARSLDEAAWVVVTRSMLRSDVKQLWGVDLMEEGASTPGGVSAPRDFQKYVPNTMKGGAIPEERVVVHQVFERPTPSFPNGRMWRCTDEVQLTEVEELPPWGVNGRRVIPIVHFMGTKLPGELLGTGIAVQAIPAQTAYNRRRSQIIEDHNLLGRPHWICPVDSIEGDQIDSAPGSVTFFDPVIGPPQQSPAHVTPQADYQELQLCAQEINDLMSRHEASQGKMGGVSSGKHAIANREADNFRFLPGIRLYEKSLGDFWRMFLAMLRTNLTDRQVAHIVGKFREPEVVTFTGGDVTDSANVRFCVASQIPWNRESMADRATWLLSQGLIQPEDYFSLLDFPAIENLRDPEYVHRTNARNENELLKTQLVMPLPSDHHEVHIREHESVLNDPARRNEWFLMRQQGEAKAQAMQAAMPPPMPAPMGPPGMGPPPMAPPMAGPPQAPPMGPPPMGPPPAGPPSPAGLGALMGAPGGALPGPEPAPMEPPMGPPQGPPNVAAMVGPANEYYRLLAHLEAHRQGIPPPQGPAPMVKANLVGELPPDLAARLVGGAPPAGSAGDQPGPAKAVTGGASPPPGTGGSTDSINGSMNDMPAGTQGTR